MCVSCTVKGISTLPKFGVFKQITADMVHIAHLAFSSSLCISEDCRFTPKWLKNTSTPFLLVNIYWLNDPPVLQQPNSNTLKNVKQTSPWKASLISTQTLFPHFLGKWFKQIYLVSFCLLAPLKIVSFLFLMTHNSTPPPHPLYLYGHGIFYGITTPCRNSL